MLFRSHRPWNWQKATEDFDSSTSTEKIITEPSDTQKQEAKNGANQKQILEPK